MQRIPKSLLFSALTICILSLSGCGPLIGKKSVTIGMMKEIGDTYEKSTLGGLGMTLVSPILLPVGLAMDITGLGEKDLVTVASVAGAAYVASKSGKNTPYTGYSNYGNSSSSDSNYSSGGSSSKSYSSSSSSSSHSSSGSRYRKSYSSSSVRKESKPLYGGKSTGFLRGSCLVKIPTGTANMPYRNTCLTTVNIKYACPGLVSDSGKRYQAHEDYPFKGVYDLPGGGLFSLKPGHDRGLSGTEEYCYKHSGNPVMAVCDIGYVPDFTSANGYRYVCIKDDKERFY